MTPREAQLSTLAGCVEYLAHEPKCRIAARKLFAVLRLEQMKLNREIETERMAARVAPENRIPHPAAAVHFERHMAIASIVVIAAVIVPYAWQVIELVREITSLTLTRGIK